MSKLFDWFEHQKGSAILITRLSLAVILIVAGYGKLMGPGIGGITAYFDSINLFPAPVLGFLVPILELFGGIAILLGVGTRLLSVWVIVQFLLITIYVKPVLMQGGWGDMWPDLTITVIGVVLISHGAGALSLGRQLFPGKSWLE